MSAPTAAIDGFSRALQNQIVSDAEDLVHRHNPFVRHRVRRLMRLMGLEALARKPRTSRPAPGHKIFPYLLRDIVIDRPTQMWAADITYIPMARGCLYLVAIIDWFSRAVLAWLSNGSRPSSG